MSLKKIKLLFDATFESVDMARGAINGVCREIFSDRESEINDFCLAVTEAMNNAVEHSGAMEIEVELIAGKDEIKFIMTVQGEEFDPTAKAAFPDISDDGALPEGGFGLAIVQELVDEVEHNYSNGSNILTLKKYFTE